MADQWLTSLITPDAQSGFDLAVKMARVAIKTTQPDDAVRSKLRPEYAQDFDALIKVSGVVGTYFQTVAAANNYWRSE